MKAWGSRHADLLARDFFALIRLAQLLGTIMIDYRLFMIHQRFMKHVVDWQLQQISAQRRLSDAAEHAKHPRCFDYSATVPQQSRQCLLVASWQQCLIALAPTAAVGLTHSPT